VDATLPPDDGGETYFDAGYYHGDGSFWVEGGAYPDANPAAPFDAGAVDASSECGTLAACCGTLGGTTEGLCASVAGSGDEANCGAELSQLEAEGDCTGVTVLASEVQIPPNRMVSDGTMLFWTAPGSPGLMATPVQGGPVTVLLSGPTGDGTQEGFLAVDALNLYLLIGDALVRIPKSGAPSSLINQPGATVFAATSLGGSAYWIETVADSAADTSIFVLASAPLAGGGATSLVTFAAPNTPSGLGVTSDTAFIEFSGMRLWSVPLNGTRSLAQVADDSCGLLASDEDAVCCTESAGGAGTNQRVANDGTTTALGQAIDSSYIVVDDTYAYWADMTTVGTILMAPKVGGGSATVIARDTSPTAIAVDANAVYWADQGGYIKSAPK
jgi:hypothetical protein